jgi:hypothetical protein
MSGIASMLEVDRWPWHVAVAWALSRNPEFTLACARCVDPYVEPYFPQVEPFVVDPDREADSWRRAGKPVLLFPSVEIAIQRLREALNVRLAFCFRRRDVVKAFPPLDYQDRQRVLGSVWRGSDPHQHPRINFAHAAWWLASQGGTQPFALDNGDRWNAAFGMLLRAIAEGRVTVWDVASLPARTVPAEYFDELLRIDLSFVGVHRSAGENAFIGCDLVCGDRYFERGQATWQRLAVSSADLIALRPGSSDAIETPPVGESDAAQTDQLDDQPGDIADDVVAAAKTRTVSYAQGLASEAIHEIWPNGAPSRAELDDPHFVTRVQTLLKKRRTREPDLRQISDSSILRAAGRKK